MKKPTPTALGLALTWLRCKFLLTKRQLADALGWKEDSPLTRFERGDRALSRPVLRTILAPLPLEDPELAVDALVFAHEIIFPGDAASAADLTVEERRTVHRAAMAGGLAAAESIRTDLIRRKKAEKATAARSEAEALWARLKAAPRQERRHLTAASPELWNVPLAARICEASVRAAAHDVKQASELADLALFIAERAPREKSLRAQGYCWAHIANARRVQNDFDGSDEAFARAWELWGVGDATASDLLPEWRLLSLEASLRREQHRFPQAVEMLDRARTAAGEDQTAAARLLLQKEHVFNAMGNIEDALAVLAEAIPLVEATGDSDLLFALRFNLADGLCDLERFTEAAELLPQVRELALNRHTELDLIRVVWLEARVAAGRGRSEEAATGLELVRQGFLDHELPYSAALASLDLAVLRLQAGRTAEVRELAVEMEAVFKAKRIRRELLAALSLFYEAAKRETVTVELTRRVIIEIQRMRRPAFPTE